MAAYWAACAALAYHLGYWAELAAPVSPPPSPPWAVALGLLSAAAPQPFYFAAVGPAAAAARPVRSWAAVTLFALTNGLLESFAFRAVRDAGAAAAGRLVGAGAIPPAAAATTRALGGLAALVAYCGAVHALFWERVFPPHLPSRDDPAARAAMRTALALFFPMTLAFAALDLRAVVAAHALADAAAAAALRLPPPWGYREREGRE